MKKLAIFLITLFIISLFTSTTFADCRGCCSRHGGVVCVDGITKCRDGTLLSPKCQSKGCDKFKEDPEILEIIHIRFNLSELIQYQPVSALD